jgi:hypothetical protein
MHGDHEIPSAFLIRALARGASHHCDRCESRMFVRSASGLCPYCAGGPAAGGVQLRRTTSARLHRASPDEPFVPRLREPGPSGGHWQRLRAGAKRARLRVSSARDLAPGEQPQPTTS